jgi:hypothetical protein
MLSFQRRARRLAQLSRPAATMARWSGCSGADNPLVGRASSGCVAVVSGGTKIEGPVDFVSGYIRHIFRFIGVKNMEIVAADQLY